MSNEQALLHCTFGWGKTCRLYLDSLEIAGKAYNLNDLTAIYPTYRNVLGVPSARLELSFGSEHLVLRGIPETDTARLLVSQLQPYCSAEPHVSRSRSRSVQARTEARAQARAWERTSKLPALSAAQEKSEPAKNAARERKRATPTRSLSLDDDELFLDEEDEQDEQAKAPTELPHAQTETAQASDAPEAEIAPEQPGDAPHAKNVGKKASDAPRTKGLRAKANAKATRKKTSELRREKPAQQKHVEIPVVDAVFAPVPDIEEYTPAPAPTDPWPLPSEQPMHTPRLQPPLRSVHLISPEQKLLDTNSMPVPAVKSSVLPIIHVPVRLQPGECAHYSIGASLCSDRISGSDRAPYPPLDHGLMILTNRRIFYIGKKSQLILAYTHLWYVSLLHSAIALHIEQQFRRIIIEVEHPHEWASRIEQLSFIARRTQPRSELPTLLVAALPGMQASSLSAATLKRPAFKKPATIGQAQQASPVANAPVLDARIVEAETVELTGQDDRSSADANTLEFSLKAEENTSDEPEQQFALAEVITQNLADYFAPLEQQYLASQKAQVNGTVQEIPEATVQEIEKGLQARESERKMKAGMLEEPGKGSTWDENACENIDTQPLYRRTAGLNEKQTETLSFEQDAAPPEKHTRLKRQTEALTTRQTDTLAQEQSDDEDDQTIVLRHRQTGPRTASGQGEPVSAQRPELEITDRYPRVRGSRLPAYARKMPPTHRSAERAGYRSASLLIRRTSRLTNS
jgi:hypothetical protein